MAQPSAKAKVRIIHGGNSRRRAKAAHTPSHTRSGLVRSLCSVEARRRAWAACWAGDPRLVRAESTSVSSIWGAVEVSQGMVHRASNDFVGAAACPLWGAAAGQGPRHIRSSSARPVLFAVL